jgi:RNA polymerase sigma-70 factor, ECF subfamily
LSAATALIGPSADFSPAAERRMVAALRRGDETAFGELIDRYQAPMLGLAQRYVRSRAVAQEVVQDTWLSVLNGIDRFEQRSSLKTWLFRILINQAKSRGVRESRNVPFSALEGDGSEPSVEPEQFLDRNHDRWPGHWAAYPSSWKEVPEERLLSQETMSCVSEAIDQLPERQRIVVTLRDVEGWSPEEVSAMLDISDGNQRILLHRARSKVRRALERYLDGG